MDCEETKMADPGEETEDKVKTTDCEETKGESGDELSTAETNSAN